MSVAGTPPITQVVLVGLGAGVQLPNMPANAQLTLKALSTNTFSIWIGPSTVTAGSNAPTDGLELAPGNFITIYAANANQFWDTASGNGQKLCILAE